MMERKSLLTGTIIGTLVGSFLTGSVVFASTSLVQAQKETATYAGVKGSALVYGGTTYAELYSVQQALKQQGVVNQWNGKAFVMDSPSQSSKALASQNEQLTQKVGNLSSILKNISKLPNSEQQQILSKLSEVATSSESSTDIQNIAQGLQTAANETSGKPGNANSTIQNILNGFQNGHSNGHSHDSSNSASTTSASTTTSVYANSGTTS